MVRLVLAIGVAAGLGSCAFDPAARPSIADNDGLGALDAGAVECSSDAECTVPPDACHVAGRCDPSTHRCSFPERDCSAWSDRCNDRRCDPADGCQRVPLADGTTCHATEASDYGDCAFEQPCDGAGTEQRTTTNYECRSGTCLSFDTLETRDCSRPPGEIVGTPCGEELCDPFSQCVYETTCSEQGSQSVDCVRFSCNLLGLCVGENYQAEQPCSRTTEGEACFCPFSFCNCQSGECVD